MICLGESFRLAKNVFDRRAGRRKTRHFREFIPTDRLPTMATFRCFREGIEVSLWVVFRGRIEIRVGLRADDDDTGDLPWCRWGIAGVGGMGCWGAAIITWEQWTLAGAGYGLRQN